MTTKPTLYASAGTLEDVADSICRFYGGTKISLVERGADEWRLVRVSDGKEFDDVRVIRRKQRFRFEGI